MHPRTLVLLVIPALLSLKYEADAEIWSCVEPGRSHPRFTNTPSVRDGEQCTPGVGDRASFAKLHFPSMESPVEARPRRGTNNNVKQTAPSERAHVIWSIKDSDDEKGGRRSAKRVCSIDGTASAPEKGRYLIRITRGALTTDELQIHLSGAARPWRKQLDGPCRNPTVTIRPLAQ